MLGSGPKLRRKRIVIHTRKQVILKDIFREAMEKVRKIVS
jgi:hypothetical protein